MLRSIDVGCGAYASGRAYISRWELVGGYPRCVEGPLSIAADPPAELAEAVARNRALTELLAQVEAYEAAMALVQGDPPQQWLDEDAQAPNPGWAAWQAAAALVDTADGDLLRLARTRADTLLPAEDGYVWGLPPVPGVPDPCTHVAEWDGEAWAVRPLAPEELSGWPLRRAPFISKMTFARQLQSVLGEEAAGAVLADFAGVLALAVDVDYADVFTGVSGGPSYAAQLLAAGTVTLAQVDALAAAWPLAT